MRMLLTMLAMSAAGTTLDGAERVTFELEWGFGPKSSEMYWDGTFQVGNGQLIALEPISFETDRHDRMVSTSGFQSYTVSGGTDGMSVVVAGEGKTEIRLTSKEGAFVWTVAELRKSSEKSFDSTNKGKLVVRIRESLVDATLLVSDKTTQDSLPAICRLSENRQIIVWRAFVARAADKGSGQNNSASEDMGADQIRGLVIDGQGATVDRFDLLEEPGDVESIAIAPVARQECQIVWAEQRDGDWQLFARSVKTVSGQIRLGKRIPLTDIPGVDKSPVLSVTADGALLLAWQAWRGVRSSIFCRTFRDGQWQDDTLALSDETANDWNPAIAASKDGKVAVAWSSWREGSYDIHLRVRENGTWTPMMAVASDYEFEAHPSMAYDTAGLLWIAYAEGRSDWGMDSHTEGLRSRRNVRLRILRNGRIEKLTGTAALALPDKFRDKSEMPLLAVDGRGVVWLLFRHLTGRGVWKVMGTFLSDVGWATPRPMPDGAGGQNVSMAGSLNDGGDLVVVWPSDARKSAVGQDSHLFQAVLVPRDRRIQPVEGEVVATSVKAVPGKKDRPSLSLDGEKRGLYFGDLHRHTELSVCQTGRDGSLEDTYRYAIDAAGLDFLCITDHVQHVKLLNDFDYWRSGKTADLHRVPGLHLPLYGYERSQRWPFGHRNIISPTRNPKRVPRTADNRPWSANSGYDGEVRVTPPELWEALRSQNVITIPHTSGSAVMGTDFGSQPAPMEPVVEIYQGCRYSYEHPNAPDPRSDSRDPAPFRGGFKAGGSIWDALGKGYRYGFIASSDHVATHNSYSCVWAKDFSAKAILEAISKRQCYAATENIVCDARMGGHFMGSEFTANAVPPLEIRVEGTTNIDRVEVIKDNHVVHSHRLSVPAKTVAFTFQDTNAKPGVHYYYYRVIQKDRNMAWVSPIWVNLQAKE